MKTMTTGRKKDKKITVAVCVVARAFAFLKGKQ